MPVVIHTAILYGSLLAAIVAAILTFRRHGDPALPPWEVLKTIWPFGLIAVLEALQLRASGHMVAEWLLPMLAAFGVAACSRNLRVIRWTRALLAVVALGLWIHGMFLLGGGNYVTRAYGLAPGKHTEKGWEAPLLGYKRVTR